MPPMRTASSSSTSSTVAEPDRSLAASAGLASEPTPASACRRLRLEQSGRLGLGHMARQENAEDRALADLGIAEDEAAGLLDDAVDHRQAEAGALADFLGGEERLEDLLHHVGRDAGAGVLDLDQHVVGRRRARG